MAILGVAMVAVGLLRELPALSVVMFIGGAAWIDFISLVTALVQKLAPDWVRARVLAVFMLVFQGGMAAGSAVWGAVGQHAGVPTALMGRVSEQSRQSDSDFCAGCRTRRRM